jgi:hypothetical protein
MTALTITPAALHASLMLVAQALGESRHEAAEAGVELLLTLTDPTHHHQPAGTFHAPTLAAEEAQPAHAHHLPAGPAEAAPDGSNPPAAAGAPAPEAPPPAQAAAGRIDWRRRSTPEDDALLRDLWPQAIPFRELLRQFNERASRPVKSDVRLRERAIRLGLPTRRHEAMVAAGNAPAGRGMVKGVWTPERDALLVALYPAQGVRAEVLDALNKLPGPPIESPNAIKARAHRLNLRLSDEGMKRVGAELAAKARAGLAAKRAERRAEIAAVSEPEPEPLPAPIEPPPPPAPVVLDDKADAFDAFDAGQSVRAVHEDFGLPLSTLSNWHAEWKRTRAKEQAA